MYYIKDMTDEKHICSICGKEYVGYGNNAQPVNDGRCCDECNLETVVPYRIYLIREEIREEKRKERENREQTNSLSL